MPFAGETVAKKWTEEKAIENPPPPCEHKNLIHKCWGCDIKKENCDMFCLRSNGNYKCKDCGQTMHVSEECPKCGGTTIQIVGSGDRILCRPCRYDGPPKNIEIAQEGQNDIDE